MENSQMISELIRVLEQENRVYDSIFKISKNKTKVIVEGKVSELENIVKLEQSLVLQVGRLETLREDLVEKLSTQLGLKPEEMNISGLLPHIDGGNALKLKTCQENLSGMINELRNSNELNSRLIRNSLDFIDFSMNLLVSTDAGVNNYGSTGHTGEGKKRSFFDVKL